MDCASLRGSTSPGCMGETGGLEEVEGPAPRLLNSAASVTPTAILSGNDHSFQFPPGSSLQVLIILF